MRNKGYPDLRAAQRRFAVCFPVLFFLSLGAHFLASAELPSPRGLIAGATAAGLMSALISRSNLTVTRVSLAALAAQFLVHWCFQFVVSVGMTAHQHGPVLAQPVAPVIHGSHSMFDGPMLAAHAIAAVVVATLLVRVDQFIAYLQDVARCLFVPLRATILVPQSGALFAATARISSGVDVCLGTLTRRGPPLTV